MRQVFVEQWPRLQRELREANDGRGLPKFITKAVTAFLDCGMLKNGFCRLYCKTCKTDQLVAFSCKARGICSSCDGKRMTELGAHLCDSVIGEVPVRQFVVTVPANLRYLLAWNVELRGKVLAAIMRALQKHYVKQAEAQGAVKPQFGAVSVLQRFAGSLRVFPHWHILVADGAWARAEHGNADQMHFMTAPPLREEQLEALLVDVAARVTLQVDRHFEKRAKSASNDDDPLQASDPSFAAVLRQSLFGKDELEALKAPVGNGLAPATPRRVGRLCLESQGFNIHAATRVHECARDRLEHLVRYVCRPAIAAKRLEAVGPHHIRIWLKNEWKGGKNAVVMTRRDLALRIMAQIPLPKRANTHYHGIWAPGAKDRDLVVPALGDRVAHNKRKHGPKCADGEHMHDTTCQTTGRDDGAEANAQAADGALTDPQLALAKPAANDGTDGSAAGTAAATPPADPACTTPPPNGEVDELAAKAASTKLTWAQALQRAFGWDLLKCPHCGGRRKMIAAIRSPSQVEKILRHVGQWREAGDRDGDDVIAIRGPPGTFDDEVDEAPGEKFDGVDDPVQMDWAA